MPIRNLSLNYPRNFFILMRFDKPIGIFLLLWPTLWALWIAAKGVPNLTILGIFLMGVVIMRAAGCVINDITDRNFDCYVTRTKTRPLTAKKLSLHSAIILFTILYIFAFILVYFLNILTIKLAIVAALLTIFYPFTKRLTHWPQFILGVAFSWSIPMAFAAVMDHIPRIAWWLFATNVLWTMTYDTEYAMTDRTDDEKIKLKSTAILFGSYDRMIIGLLQITILFSLAAIGYALKIHGVYFISLIIASLIFLNNQRLTALRQPQAYFQAFLNNHWFGLIVFLGIALSYL